MKDPDEDDDDDDSVEFTREVTDDAIFTIDNIGETTTKVESTISPLLVIKRSYPMVNFVREKKTPIEGYGSSVVMLYAIIEGNADLLSFLLDLVQDASAYLRDKEWDEEYNYSYNFVAAIKYGRLQCLSMLMKRTAAGLPFEHLTKTGGNVEKPDYYLGLSIHGKKRHEWRQPDWMIMGWQNPKYSRYLSSPLLNAASEGSFASVEWFLSTSPERHYMEFVHTHKHDGRVKKLGQETLGIEKCITDWLSLRGMCKITVNYTIMT